MTSTPQQISVSVEQEVSEATAQVYFEIYQETFGALATLAAARQLLHKDEFMEEMLDHRISKYLAHDADGEVVGMSTLTSHLETVPWISADYFEAHYPEHAARGAIFYLGFTLVRRRQRRSRVFSLMVSTIVELLVERRAVCAWDICSHNDNQLSLGGNIERLLHRNADVTVAPIDRQTYYAGTFHGVSGVPNPRASPT